MADQWYVAREGQRYGPYTREELAFYARSGNVGPADLVWSASTGDWVPMQEVAGLAPAVGSREPAAPSGRRRGKRTLVFIGGGLLLVSLMACGILWVALGEGLPEWLTGGVLRGDGTTRAPITTVEGDTPFWEEDLQSALGPLDDPDWRTYPDREEEEEAIAETLEGFAGAMQQGDVDRSVAYILDERREAYRELFSANPEAMASFADVIAQAEISFLSEGGGSTPYDRIAEYSVDLDGFAFYVILRKVDGTWLLYDF
jgi:hypothetical protein